jgi:hypothetical protein
VTTLPAESGAFDIVVAARDPAVPAAEFAQILGEAARVIRHGGRVVVIDGTRRSGLLGWIGRPSGPPPDGDAIRVALEHTGLRAARVLAEVDGVAYVEAAKPRR